MDRTGCSLVKAESELEWAVGCEREAPLPIDPEDALLAAFARARQLAAKRIWGELARFAARSMPTSSGVVPPGPVSVTPSQRAIRPAPDRCRGGEPPQLEAHAPPDPSTAAGCASHLRPDFSTARKLDGRIGRISCRFGPLVRLPRRFGARFESISSILGSWVSRRASNWNRSTKAASWA